LSEERIRNLSFNTFTGLELSSKKEFSFGQLIIWNGMKILRITENPGTSISLALYKDIDYLIVADQSYYKTILNADISVRKKILIDPVIKEKSSRMREDFYYVNKMGAFVCKE
jgi:hypothetical protein